MNTRLFLLVCIGTVFLSACQIPDAGDSITNNNYFGNQPPASGLIVVNSTLTTSLLFVDPADPSTITGGVVLRGLVSGDSIRDLDYRPADGKLYGLGSLGHLYRIDTSTGACLAITTSALSVAGSLRGIDFNPVVDRLRVVSELDTNLRANPDSGEVTLPDTNLQYAAGDVNLAANPQVSSVAYINNFVGTTTTLLYGIDLALNCLVTQLPPNAGTLNTVGSLGITAIATTSGFDISPTGTAYAALCTTGPLWKLYTINLLTGAATLVNTIGNGGAIAGIAVVP